jgi:hypothetical protein
MVNQKPTKKSNYAPKKKEASPPDKQLNTKTVEFLAKLQKIHDNVIKDINDL